MPTRHSDVGAAAAAVAEVSSDGAKGAQNSEWKGRRLLEGCLQTVKGGVSQDTGQCQACGGSGCRCGLLHKSTPYESADLQGDGWDRT